MLELGGLLLGCELGLGVELGLRLVGLGVLIGGQKGGVDAVCLSGIHETLKICVKVNLRGGERKTNSRYGVKNLGIRVEGGNGQRPVVISESNGRRLEPVESDAKACLFRKERGEREARGREKREKGTGGEHFFSQMKAKEKGRYVQTGGE